MNRATLQRACRGAAALRNVIASKFDSHIWPLHAAYSCSTCVYRGRIGRVPSPGDLAMHVHPYRVAAPHSHSRALLFLPSDATRRDATQRDGPRSLRDRRKQCQGLAQAGLAVADFLPLLLPATLRDVRRARFAARGSPREVRRARFAAGDTEMVCAKIDCTRSHF
ncbi:hypothetical protein ALC62_05290 [Cyphomyrmex costatus]|uniref:Uncharacterized protein n=1 Tax=Cyphomyrmex costatus TaxID=456900 RepID=A0A151IJQ0_9HYME|nr:hypothetical protein ALC62_05290 [Cyphomyrmex costatus]